MASFFLGRGARFTIDGYRFAALGGAHSIDRQLRTKDIDWFVAEEITDEDLDHLATGGNCDVLLTHDAPIGYEIPGLALDRALPRAWLAERPACDAHRARVRSGVESVRPSLLLHGHYHRYYERTQPESWSDLRIVGLACDGKAGSIATLEITAAGIEVEVA